MDLTWWKYVGEEYQILKRFVQVCLEPFGLVESFVNQLKKHIYQIFNTWVVVERQSHLRLRLQIHARIRKGGSRLTNDYHSGSLERTQYLDVCTVRDRAIYGSVCKSILGFARVEADWLMTIIQGLWKGLDISMYVRWVTEPSTALFANPC